MKKLLALTTLLTCPYLLFAQYVLTGQLQDGATQTPIPYASILLLNPLDSTLVLGTVSDESGNFTLTTPNQQAYLFGVQMIGYQEVFRTVSPTNTLPRVLELLESATTLREVAVIGKRSSLKVELGKRTFYVGQDMISGGGDLSSVLEQLPATEVDEEGNISVRGSGNVLIYINGKESKRDGRSLSSLPADLIEKVELITNPSAQYDAEGVSGIINIVYRKNRADGFQTILTQEIGLPLRVQTGFQSNYKVDKVNTFLNANYRLSTANNSYTAEQENFALSSTFLNQQEGISNSGVWSVNGGMEWFIDSNATLSLTGEYFRWASNKSVDFVQSKDDAAPVLLDNYFTELEDEFEFSLGYQRTFSEEAHALNALINYGGEVENNTDNFNRQQVDLSGTALSDILSASQVDEVQRLASVILDYKHPLSDHQRIAIGGKSQYVNYDILQQLDFTDQMMALPDNDFTVTQWQHALYGMYTHRWQSLEIGVGARLENFTSQATQQSLDSSFQRQATRLFPSAQLSYQIKDNQSLGLTYSKRIQRPGFFDLNPFIYYTDPLNLSTGNPFLQPELSDALELNYNLILDSWNFNLTLFRRFTENSIQMGAFQDGQQTVSRPTNFASRSNMGVELNWRTNIVDFWSVDVQSSWLRSTFTSNGEDLIFQNRQSSWRVRLEQQIDLPKAFQLQVTGLYRSPRFTPQRTTLAQYYLNLGLSKSWADEQWKTVLSLTDVFRTRRLEEVLLGADFRLQQSWQYQFQRLRFRVTYRWR